MSKCIVIFRNWPFVLLADESKTEDKLNNVALIVGVILGSTVLLLLVAVIVLSVCLYRRKNYVRADSKSENNAVEVSLNECSRNNARYETTPRNTMYPGQGETPTSGARNIAYEDTNGETNAYEVLRRENREP